MKNFLLFLLFIVSVILAYRIGFVLAIERADTYNPFIMHMEMTYEGYQYCPYCGNQLNLTDY